jgi:hypothetical protein
MENPLMALFCIATDELPEVFQRAMTNLVGMGCLFPQSDADFHSLVMLEIGRSNPVFPRLLKVAIEIVDFPIENGDFP